MFFREVITLLTDVYIQNDIGDNIETEQELEVFADKISIGQNEFYLGMAQGIKPDISFKIRRADYNNQKKVIYNNKKYDVLKAQIKDTEIIKLTLTRKMGDTLDKHYEDISETLTLTEDLQFDPNDEDIVETLTLTELISVDDYSPGAVVGTSKVDYSEVD